MSTAPFSLILKRNCSMSPKALAGVFAALSVLVLAIGAGFAAAGAWLILPFAGLEVLLLGAAFLLYARHAADYERIELDAGRLSVEVARAECIERHELDARATTVSVEQDRVMLRGREEQLEIGRHLDADRRRELAAELDKRLVRGTGA